MGMFDSISRGWNEVVTVATELVDEGTTAVSNAWEKGTAVATELVDEGTTAVSNAWEKGTAVAAELVDEGTTAVSNAWDKGTAVANELVDEGTTAVSNAWDKGTAVATELVDEGTTAVSNAWDKGTAVATELVDEGTTAVSNAWDKGTAVANDIRNYINPSTLYEDQGVEHQYRLSPTDPTFVDATLSFEDMANGYHLEYNSNGILWRVQASGEPHPDDLAKYQEQQLVTASVFNYSIDLETVHNLLDGAGFIPVAGAVPDLANSALYLYEGNYKEAGISAVAALPVAGDYFAATLKGSKIFKGIEESRKAKTGLIQKSEVTTYQDFVNRSKVGDNLEGHEVLQHANLKANGFATERLSTEASKNNPVIALEKSQHMEINKAQRTLDAAKQTPEENIKANADLLRKAGISEEIVQDIMSRALGHAERLIQ